MPFITRLSRLIRADLNAVLDRLEAPELVLEQAVREMEHAQEQGRARLRQLERVGVELAARQSDLTRGLERAEDALEDCLGAGQDGLARAVIRSRLETERQLEALAGRASAVSLDRDTLAARLEVQAQRLEELREQARLHACSAASVASPPVACESTRAAVRDTDIEVALLQAKRQRGQS